ncbi:hypothetical protein, partial [Saccharopolyspora shandongensis]|uniref:hypothetical protein n=1 Tax=Saccharopolyspora shandongensis TaxID=418495 RepID=UPI0033E9F4E4
MSAQIPEPVIQGGRDPDSPPSGRGRHPAHRRADRRRDGLRSRRASRRKARCHPARCRRVNPGRPGRGQVSRCHPSRARRRASRDRTKARRDRPVSRVACRARQEVSPDRRPAS